MAQKHQGEIWHGHDALANAFPAALEAGKIA